MTIKHDIIINNFAYQVHLEKECCKRKFKCITNYSLIDDEIETLHDIYFIDYELFTEYNNNNSFEIAKNDEQQHIVFPNCDVRNQFGTSFENFAQDVLSLDTAEHNIVDFYDGNPIPCDMLKIYHPNNKTDLEYILYVNSIINGVNIHFICCRNDMMKMGGDCEFSVNNNAYSEYLYTYIPNIEAIVKEDIYKISPSRCTDAVTRHFYESISELIKPFCTYKEMVRDIYGTYWKDLTSGEYHSISSLDDFENGMFWLYADAEGKEPFATNRQMYMYDGEVQQVLLQDLYIKYCDECYRITDNSEFQIYNEVIKKTYVDTDQEYILMTTPINVLIFPYGDIDNKVYTRHNEYLPNSEQFIQNMSFKLSTEINFKQCDDSTDSELSVIGHFIYPVKVDNVWKTYKKLNNIDDNVSLDISITLQIATDSLFSNIIYDSPFILESESKEPYDFLEGFTIPIQGIDNLFDTWNDMIDIIALRVIFNDPNINLTLYSNPMNLTKEQYKYAINKEKTKVFDMTKLENTILVDKVSCFVNETKQNQIISSTPSTNVKIIYKPIFYRTHDVNTLELKTNMKQNVGINLSDYMSKVEAFKLSIDGNQTLEYARNDAYVIFTINTLNISALSGQYHILNLDNEYITSGAYRIL